MPGPLAGVRILDFTMFQQGAEGTRILGEMGAEVIKIEPTLLGDLGRYNALLPEPERFSTYFLSHNRGKRSVAMNLKRDGAREIIFKLVATCDVVAHNFRPGVMEKLRLTYDDFKAVKPDIIYAFATAFGTRGERACEAGFDIAGQAMGGLMSVTGDGEYPVPAGAAAADFTGAMHLALGIVSALYHRERTGKGQSLDVSLLGSIIALQGWEMTYHLVTRAPARKAGLGHPLVPTVWRVFKTADDYLVIGGIGEDRWPGLCRATGLERLKDDERFKNHFVRYANMDELHGLLAEVLLTKSNAEWLERLRAEDLIYAPVMTYEQIRDDPQVRANDYVVTIDNPATGPIDVTGLPINFSETPVEIASSAPELGQQTEEVLLELGFDWDEISALRNKEII
jgi:crotonobetainyl-CoA:carnitine CoA-transferase CaiB-like acyl-CoA transferase